MVTFTEALLRSGSPQFMRADLVKVPLAVEIPIWRQKLAAECGGSKYHVCVCAIPRRAASVKPAQKGAKVERNGNAWFPGHGRGFVSLFFLFEAPESECMCANMFRSTEQRDGRQSPPKLRPSSKGERREVTLGGVIGRVTENLDLRALCRMASGLSVIRNLKDCVPLSHYFRARARQLILSPPGRPRSWSPQRLRRQAISPSRFWSTGDSGSQNTHIEATGGNFRIAS